MESPGPVDARCWVVIDDLSEDLDFPVDVGRAIVRHLGRAPVASLGSDDVERIVARACDDTATDTFRSDLDPEAIVVFLEAYENIMAMMSSEPY